MVLYRIKHQWIRIITNIIKFHPHSTEKQKDRWMTPLVYSLKHVQKTPILLWTPEM